MKRVMMDETLEITIEGITISTEGTRVEIYSITDEESEAMIYESEEEVLKYIRKEVEKEYLRSLYRITKIEWFGRNRDKIYHHVWWEE